MSDAGRRAVVRGIAWSVPVVTLAAQAPAFAASASPPSVGANAYSACKQQGLGSNCQGIRMTVTFTVDAPYEWTIDITSVKVNGTEYSATIVPASGIFVVSSTNPTLTFEICTNTSSPSQFLFELAYTVTRPGEGTTSVVVPARNVTGVGPC